LGDDEAILLGAIVLEPRLGAPRRAPAGYG
jgi:hypothetical protein